MEAPVNGLLVLLLTIKSGQSFFFKQNQVTENCARYLINHAGGISSRGLDSRSELFTITWYQVMNKYLVSFVCR